MTLIVEQDYRLYLQVARQELHFQRQLLIVVMEAARRSMTMQSTIGTVKGMRCLGMTCALMRQYHQKVIEEEHRVCHDARAPLNFDPDQHHWLPNDVALPLGEQTMAGRIVLLPHIYTKIMRMLGGTPIEARTLCDEQDVLSYDIFLDNVRSLNEVRVWRTVIGGRQQMMGQVPQPREPRVVQNWMEPTRPENPPIIITTTTKHPLCHSPTVQTTDINLLKEYQRSVRRLVYLMREQRSMNLLQDMLLFLK
jgi:hypothetical protein